MQRPDGKHAVTVILTQQDVDALQLIMAETYRETMTDCIRAIRSSWSLSATQKAARSSLLRT